MLDQSKNSVCIVFLPVSVIWIFELYHVPVFPVGITFKWILTSLMVKIYHENYGRDSEIWNVYDQNLFLRVYMIRVFIMLMAKHILDRQQTGWHVGYADWPLCHHVFDGRPMSLLPKVHVVLPVQYGIGHHQSLVPCSKVGMTLNFTQLKYVHYDTIYQESFLIYLPLFLEVYMPVITLRGIFRTKFIF